MALQKPTVSHTGAPSPESYWRPQQITFLRLENTVSVVFYGYHDAESARAGVSPIDQLTIEMSPAEMAATVGAPITQAEMNVIQPFTPYNIMMSRIYRTAKKREYFSSATDV